MDIERVSQNQSWAIRAYGPSERPAGPSASRGDREGVQRADSLEISESAREMARARQAVDAAPDVRSEKVAAIKKRIEDGTYSVSPDLLARKMLRDAGHD